MSDTEDGGGGGWQWAGDDSDDDEDDYGGGTDKIGIPSDGIKSIPGKDAVIYLVDCTDAMAKETDTGNSAFTESIKLITKSLYQQMITRPSDLVGVVFYGTKMNQNSNDYEHVVEFQELNSPDVGLIRRLEAISEGREDVGHGTTEEVEKSHGDNALLKYALSTCQLMISQTKTKLADRRVVIFTMEADPYPAGVGSPKKRDSAIVQASDIKGKGIGIEIMPLCRQRFDYDTFYNCILSSEERLSQGDDGVGGENDSLDMDALLIRLQSKVQRFRPLMKIPFDIGSGNTVIGIRLYQLFRPAKKGTSINVHNRDDRGYPKVETKTMYKCETNVGTTQLRPEEINRCIAYGGEQVIFTAAEVAKMKHFDAPGLTLLGFKPSSRLKIHTNVKNSLLAYPDESVVKGSTTMFCALRDSCVRKDKIVICRLIGSRSQEPRIVALSPTKATDNSPVGFHLIYLPYTDDMRKIEYTKSDTPHGTSAQIDNLTAVINKLTDPEFDCRNYKNPVVERHFAAIQAAAFDDLTREVVRNVVDRTDVPVKDVHARASDEIQTAIASLYPEGYTPGEKRKTTPKAKAAAKKVKAENGDAGLSVLEMKDYVTSNKIKLLTVGELKTFLTAQGQKATGKKADLITSVTAFIESQ